MSRVHQLQNSVNLIHVSIQSRGNVNSVLFFNLRIVLFFFLNPYSSERNFVATMKGVFFLCIRIRRKQLEETHYINTSVIRKNKFVAIGLLQNKWQRVSSRTNDNTKQGSRKKLKQLFSNSFCIVFFCESCERSEKGC